MLRKRGKWLGQIYASEATAIWKCWCTDGGDGIGGMIDAKIAALNLAETYEEKGAAAQALVDAKAYTDAEMAKVQALSEEDIDAAIAAAQA